MALNIKDFEISKTFNNVVLTTVTGSPDTDGVPTISIPSLLEGYTQLRAQGRLQDGFGTAIPLVLSRNLIEVEADPLSANSVMRRRDIHAIRAQQYIHNLIWS
jgi:hypothetical protein